jgi:hypothetical protein
LDLCVWANTKTTSTPFLNLPPEFDLALAANALNTPPEVLW